VLINNCEKSSCIAIYEVPFRFQEQEENGNLVSSFFVYLLKKYVYNCADADSSTKRVIIVFLLAQLSQDSDTLRSVKTSIFN
jgi:hypothetical protein